MLTVLCPAKVNLFLAIKGKDATGYHLLDTVFMRTRLFQDSLTFERADAFSFHCPSLPAEENSVVKAVHVLEAHTGKKFNYRITLHKGIPVGSGLGGASSDAASTLLKLNDLESLQLSQKTLFELGAQVGMDVPFFLSGFTVAHGTHCGEQIELLPSLPPHLELELKVGETPFSTKEMFNKWDATGLESKKNSQEFIAALRSQDAENILKNLHNDFQMVAAVPEGFTLSGSGSAYFCFKVA